ncbi:MAG: ImmA/IrrE family metallo-endopeptidase [Clostridia bacterium]|nr:ImmA/IrrE family metallo-endopeptidase [Clostridia bacterium]
MSTCLSRNDLEKIADRYIREYYERMEISESSLLPVLPEFFAEDILNLTVVFLPLSDDGSILGVSSFEDFEFAIVDDSGYTETRDLSEWEIAIDKGLLSPEQSGRCNFTIMHEAAHHILRRLFPQDYQVKQIFYRDQRSPQDWIEWQADTLAACLLMPPKLMEQCVKEFEVYQLKTNRDYEKFCRLASYLDVSKQALLIRLQHLNLLSKENMRQEFTF